MLLKPFAFGLVLAHRAIAQLPTSLPIPTLTLDCGTSIFSKTITTLVITTSTVTRTAVTVDLTTSNSTVIRTIPQVTTVVDTLTVSRNSTTVVPGLYH